MKCHSLMKGEGFNALSVGVFAMQPISVVKVLHAQPLVEQIIAVFD
jgi:hypothetical protein